MKSLRHSSTGAEAIAQVAEIGVGVVYSSGLEPLFAAEPGLIDALEIEPQTTWLESPGGAITVRADVDDHLDALPGRKLIHSIGTPVGGSAIGTRAQLERLAGTVRRFRPPFVSEHLAFNTTRDFFTGFFLPPRQTAAGLSTYTRSINDLRETLGVPIAAETGVNYLQPRADEIPDGEFMAELANPPTAASSSTCTTSTAITATDARNSILTSAKFHWIASGKSISRAALKWTAIGSMPTPARSRIRCSAVAREIIPHLPNLKVMIFEMFTSDPPQFGLDAVRAELGKLRTRGNHARQIHVR